MNQMVHNKQGGGSKHSEVDPQIIKPNSFYYPVGRRQDYGIFLWINYIITLPWHIYRSIMEEGNFISGSVASSSEIDSLKSITSSRIIVNLLVWRRSSLVILLFFAFWVCVFNVRSVLNAITEYQDVRLIAMQTMNRTLNVPFQVRTINGMDINFIYIIISMKLDSNFCIYTLLTRGRHMHRNHELN